MQVASQEAVSGRIRENHALGYMLRMREDSHGSMLHCSKAHETDVSGRKCNECFADAGRLTGGHQGEC